MLVAACLTELWVADQMRQRWPSVAIAIIGVGSVVAYGGWRIQSPLSTSERPLQVALLQGTRDKVFEYNPELEEQSFQQYYSLMQRARDANSDIDLIIWPEGAFTASLPELLLQGPVESSPEVNIPAQELQRHIERRQSAFAEKLRQAAEEANRGQAGRDSPGGEVHLLIGNATFELDGRETRHYNSALWIDPAGRLRGRYYKMHRVMFGEYIPFGRAFPWLANLTPIGLGLVPGETPASFLIHGYRLAPSICFESTVPHVIRRQVRRLGAEIGHPPDVLVNITDDGWFWGSSILDLHLACAAFRAVEMRRPLLVAANTGISAQIDGNGRVLQRLPHRREGFLLASVSRDGRSSLYERSGDVFPGLCLLLSIWWIIRVVPTLRHHRRLEPTIR
jgi:apolipoprotein N-acyltransferase